MKKKNPAIEDKSVRPEPLGPGMVRIQIRDGRSIEGIGGPLEIVQVPVAQAERFVLLGYAVVVE